MKRTLVPLDEIQARLDASDIPRPISGRVAVVEPSLADAQRASAGQLRGQAQRSGDTARNDTPLGGDGHRLDEGGASIIELPGLRGRERDRAAMSFTTQKLDWVHERRWSPKVVTVSATPRRATPGHWLIFSDQLGVGAALAARLRSDGQQAVCVHVGTRFECRPDGTYTVRPDSADDIERLVTAMTATGYPWRGAVHLWSLDTVEEPGDAVLPTEAQEQTCHHVTLLSQALTARPAPAAGLWLVTRGAQATAPGRTPSALAQAPLWGLGRAIRFEHPAIRGALIDLDPGAGFEDGAAHLLDEIFQADGEDQIAYRNGTRHVARFVACAMPPEEPQIDLQPSAAYLATGA